MFANKIQFAVKVTAKGMMRRSFISWQGTVFQGRMKLSFLDQMKIHSNSFLSLCKLGGLIDILDI